MAVASAASSWLCHEGGRSPVWRLQGRDRESGAERSGAERSPAWRGAEGAGAAGPAPPGLAPSAPAAAALAPESERASRRRQRGGRAGEAPLSSGTRLSPVGRRDAGCLAQLTPRGQERTPGQLWAAQLLDEAQREQKLRKQYFLPELLRGNACNSTPQAAREAPLSG